jgi:LPXTG-motif cell wall-anchored protein
MNPTRLTTSAALALGLLTVAWPLAWLPAWTYLVAGLGAAAVLAAAFLKWRPGPAVAVAAAVVSCAAADAPVAVLAVEGLVILCYLIGVPPQLGPWARGQVPLVAAGALAGAAVLAAFAVRPSDSAWLALAGLAAAVAAYLVALRRREKATRGGPEDEHLF